MIFKTFLLFISIAVVFSGCGSSPTPKPKPKVIPAWVSAPLPDDNEQYMYGLGVESDRDSAIKAALSDMVSKLGTTIESSYQSNQEV